MTRLLAQITAPHFVAGLEMEGDRCVLAAPIIRYMVGKDRSWIRGYCQRKGWGIRAWPITPVDSRHQPS